MVGIGPQGSAYKAAFGSLTMEHRTTRGAERLRSLKQAAIDMFLQEGFEAVSLDSLIARVGGSRRNIYDHFGGKEGLFIEAVAELCEELAAPLKALDIHGDDPRTALTIFGRKALEIVLQPRTIALHRLMIAEGQRFPDLSQSIWGAGHMNATQMLARWIEAKQREKLLRTDIDGEDLAAQFITLTVTTAQLRCLVGFEEGLSSEAIEKTVEDAVTVFLTGALEGEARPFYA